MLIHYGSEEKLLFSVPYGCHFYMTREIVPSSHVILLQTIFTKKVVLFGNLRLFPYSSQL